MEDERAVTNNQNDLLRERILRLLMEGEVTMQRWLEQLERDIGLRTKRIERFQQFRAGESMVGERCVVCLDDLVVGKQMVRLDCHVDHYLCEACALGWFKEHNTCPHCRHEFK